MYLIFEEHIALHVPFLGACAKLREATISFVMSARRHEKNWAPTGRIFMKFDI